LARHRRRGAAPARRGGSQPAGGEIFAALQSDAHNADALTQLIDTHGVPLRRYSDDLLILVGRVAEDVVADIGNSDQLTRRVYESYLAFRRRAVGWAQIADQGYLAARALLFA
jgi:TRAP-type mannitol/chloroaromatic compound transport system substrate-binding protein